jgi:Family of unknown function (DUF5335)
MRTRDISYDQWELFFNDFSALYRGQQVNVETIAENGAGAEPNLSGMPLVSVVATYCKSASDERIEVIARKSRDTCATHWIQRPRKVCSAEEDGRQIAIQIESADGSITIIRFDPPKENMPAGYRIS